MLSASEASVFLTHYEKQILRLWLIYDILTHSPPGRKIFETRFLLHSDGISEPTGTLIYRAATQSSDRHGRIDLYSLRSCACSRTKGLP